ncbi:MAG: hypothetical protein HXS47_01270 [Theionarchaea archaeon]|nr:hypothetical protein [Theionarchaea archaeon]
MTAEKPLFFITQEKSVKHVGRYDAERGATFFMSPEALTSYGYDKDTSVLKESEDAAYIFSAHLPLSVVESWFNQISTHHTRIQSPDEPCQKVHQDERIHTSPVLLPPRRILSHEEKIRKIQKIESLREERYCTIRQPPKRKKTLSLLKEEIHGQHRWDNQVPTCGQCQFWETQYLRFTDSQVGVCTITGNFTDPSKRACSEFQR